MFKKGQSGNPAGRKAENDRSGGIHTLLVLARLRREPVKELIAIADKSENADFKTAIWKYLLERRDEGVGKVENTVPITTSMLKELEAQHPPTGLGK